MSSVILCVGKMKEKPYRQMADEYLKRLSRYGKYEETEIADLPEPASGTSEALEEQLKTKEGEALLAKIRPGDRVIALTIGGKRRSSEELARHLAELKTGGVSHFVFVIGGSLGLGKNVLARADEEMSMSPMTFPHQLARVMLLEQLYRAEKINAGERYHK
ncbi:23S rRNA (pseudouridine(1915)-N(3))-methyltransferase RlmH [Aristaeella lactis]|uniref:23S rRNA (Pseudouridine1915-N3)-methyltransferase n=1 Tax=Aristaeella lactis TaxID=3046383 RepID=A0AC61PNE2_9FIRM|nr:23S rRNA (pseudouridine(1915)-N(3))-methyltransferase RlmH [Aristaeella lactis]QUA52508.1 23S rRNA (pseudouridine(1915)-N(3))-methyltransferase RlmH [Aristaeella lactis]SMC76544.1 23S rRNA (pseudouridine1915-N3)-methyltransferase [Aristaeella lactis]